MVVQKREKKRIQLQKNLDNTSCCPASVVSVMCIFPLFPGVFSVSLRGKREGSISYYHKAVAMRVGYREEMMYVREGGVTK